MHFTIFSKFIHLIWFTRLRAEERAQEEKESHQHNFLRRRPGRRGRGWGRLSEELCNKEEPHSSRTEQRGGCNRSPGTHLPRVASPERHSRAGYRQLGGVAPSVSHSARCLSSPTGHKEHRQWGGGGRGGDVQTSDTHPGRGEDLLWSVSRKVSLH